MNSVSQAQISTKIQLEGDTYMIGETEIYIALLVQLPPPPMSSIHKKSTKASHLTFITIHIHKREEVYFY